MKSLFTRGRYHLLTGRAARLSVRPTHPGSAFPGPRPFHTLSPRGRREGEGGSPQQGGSSMIGEDVMAPSTEADQLRQQLLQAQRLSSVGALASSVAHEFNNILTTIINYARLALRPNHDEGGRTQALEKILKGSQRAAVIINSMLGFARNNSTQRELTDLAALVEETLVLTDKDLSKHRVQVETKFHGRPRARVVP